MMLFPSIRADRSPIDDAIPKHLGWMKPRRWYFLQAFGLTEAQQRSLRACRRTQRIRIIIHFIYH